MQFAGYPLVETLRGAQQLGRCLRKSLCQRDRVRAQVVTKYATRIRDGFLYPSGLQIVVCPKQSNHGVRYMLLWLCVRIHPEKKFPLPSTSLVPRPSTSGRDLIEPMPSTSK